MEDKPKANHNLTRGVLLAICIALFGVGSGLFAATAQDCRTNRVIIVGLEPMQGRGSRVMVGDQEIWRGVASSPIGISFSMPGEAHFSVEMEGSDGRVQRSEIGYVTPFDGDEHFLIIDGERASWFYRERGLPSLLLDRMSCIGELL